jgi:D-alanyl-D-alanine carboxypeptidase
VVALAAAAALLVGACSSADSPPSGGSPGATTGGSVPGTTAGSTPGATALPAAQLDAARALLDDWVAVGNAPGAMVQVTTPDGTWTETFGVADPGDGEPMSIDRQHRIGSVTKSFTTTLILMLVDEGKLSLDDPVADYVDGVPGGDQITIEMLGNMTSGLPEFLGNAEFRAEFFADPLRTWTPQELLAASYELGQDFPPGTSSAYSNANTVLLGLVAEAVEQKPFAEILDEKILGPQGLDGTAFPADAAFFGPHTSGATTLDPAQEVVDSTAWSPTQAFTAGQMISTVEDLTRWGELLASGELISPELQERRLQWEPLGDNDEDWHYTFGVEVNTGWLGHNGMIPGYMTFVVHHPEIDSTVVLVQNTDKNVDGEPGINPLMRQLMTALFPEHPMNVPVVG